MFELIALPFPGHGPNGLPGVNSNAGVEFVKLLPAFSAFIASSDFGLGEGSLQGCTSREPVRTCVFRGCFGDQTREPIEFTGRNWDRDFEDGQISGFLKGGILRQPVRSVRVTGEVSDLHRRKRSYPQ